MHFFVECDRVTSERLLPDVAKPVDRGFRDHHN